MRLAAGCVLLVLPSLGQVKEDDRLKESHNVLKEILRTPDNGIARDLLDKAVSVVVYPSVKKPGFIVGGSYGRGAITCRSGEDFRGPWSAPARFALQGASVGFQIGGEATDFVLLVMNEKGASSVMSSKVKLGADASAAAGPVGRTSSAETDVVMKAEILCWARACFRRRLPGKLHHAIRRWRQQASLWPRAEREGNRTREKGADTPRPLKSLSIFSTRRHPSTRPEGLELLYSVL